MYFETGSLAEIVTGRSWSPDELKRQVFARMRRDDDYGLAPGDRVLILADNTLEFIAELLAVWLRGAVAVPLDCAVSPFELVNLLAAAGPRLVVRTGDHMPAWVSEVPLVDARDVAACETGPASRLQLDTDSLILFTSGSTGTPKGVVHTHRSLLAQWTRLRQALGTPAYRRTLCMLPVYFGHGLICNVLFPLLSGCDVWLGPAFSPTSLIGLGRFIDKHGITAMSSVPSLWRLALRVSAPPRNGSLRRVHCGSAPLSAHLWMSIAEWSAPARVINTYGITETASWIGGSLDGAPEDGCIGGAWGGLIRVLQPGASADMPAPESECKTGETGHLWVQTPALMRGYLDRDDLTSAVVRGGWFYTGDLGVRDERGRSFLSGRAVDEINKGGLKIQPQDVENVAAAYPHVKDACVFGVADELYGQNVAIAFVLENSSAAGPAEFQSWMRERLSRHKLPSVWYQVDAIPRSGRGKLRRETVAAECAALQPLTFRTSA